MKNVVFGFVFLILVSAPLSSQESLYDDGLEAYRDKRYLEAIVTFDRFVAQNPVNKKNDDAKWRIGRSLVRLDRLSEAEMFFREVSSGEGNRRDDATFDLGRLLFDLDRKTEALGVLTGYTEAYPGALRADDAYWYVGLIHESFDRIDDAEQSFRKVLDYPDSNVRDETLYDLGRLLYFQDRDSEALEIFDLLITEYPDDSKVDDALWRSGRIYRRLNRDDEAEARFLRILTIPSANRKDEAEYELAKIDYYVKKDYLDILERNSGLLDRENLSESELKTALLTAKAYYRQGLIYRRDFLDENAADFFERSIIWYDFLLARAPSLEAETEYYIASAKAYEHLANLSRENHQITRFLDAAESAYELAARNINDDKKDDALSPLSELRRSRSAHIEYDVEAAGGFENLSRNFAAQASASVTGILPIGVSDEIYGEISFEHSGFMFKTGYFDPAKTGTDRQIQRSEIFGFETGWKSGSYRTLHNILKIDSSYRLAEYSGDNRLRIALEDSLTWRIGPNWRTNVDSYVRVEFFPNYLSGSDRRDAFDAELSPGIEFSGWGPVTLGLNYEFSFKQYFQNTVGASSLSRQYIGNGGVLELEGRFGVFRPNLKYRIGWLESNNYDYLVTGLPADQFVNDYWDHLYQELGLDLEFRWSSRFRTTLSGVFEYTSFANYPVRDVTNTFTGEKRTDFGFELSFDAELVMWEKGFLSLSTIAEAWWKYQSSNMLYENSISTNYDYVGAYLGIRFRGR